MPRNLVSLSKKRNENINIHYNVSGSVVSIISPGIKCLSYDKTHSILSHLN